MNNVLIIGSSGHASSVIEAIEKGGRFTIAGLIDDFKNEGDKSYGYDILGKITDIKRIAKEYNCQKLFIAIGENWSRHLVFKRLESLGLDFITVIHPSAVLAKGVHIGDGSFIGANTVINKGSFIGDFVVINTGAVIEHDNAVLDFTSVSPRAVTGGNVHLGKFVFVGMGAVLKNGVTVGEHTVIGCGSTVLDFITDHKVAYGSPAKEIHSRKNEDKVL